MNAFKGWLAAERGRGDRLANELGIGNAAVSMWRGVVPLERLEQVSKITGIPAAELRPDLARIFNNGGDEAA